MQLTPGARLGNYEIVAPLGAGGMGEVYRARDLRFGREVALKVLPAEVANDAGRLARFEHEARTVAALNHPNIVTLFTVEDVDDLGRGPRHMRGQRVAQGPAPMRETLAAQLVLLPKWMPHEEPLVDPTSGSGTIAVEAALLARGFAVRKPQDLPALRSPVFAGFPAQAPPLYPDTRPYILASDINEEGIAWMIGNLRASGLTGRDVEQSIVVRSMDATELTPERFAEILPDAPR